MAKYKKRFIYSETHKAEEIINNGFPNKEINYGEMYVVAKYFRLVQGMGERKLENKLIEFCTKQSKDFNPVLDADYIKKWVRHAMKSDHMREVDKLVITQAEMEKIKTIRDLQHRKVLFALLVFAKSSAEKIAEKYFVNFSRFKDVIELLDFRMTEPTLINILSEFYALKLIVVYSPEKELIRIDFAKDDSPMALTIKQIDRSLEYYKTYFGGVSGYCADCGREIVKKSNSQVRCESCSILKKKETNKAIKTKKRNKTNFVTK
jgi:DNA-directed RNA polymerase subunit RPC12/RpoP